MAQNLAAQKNYNNLCMTMREALASRACCVEGVLKCYSHETLETIIDRIAKAEVPHTRVTGHIHAITPEFRMSLYKQDRRGIQIQRDFCTRSTRKMCYLPSLFSPLGLSVRCIVWCWLTVTMWWEGLSLYLTFSKPWFWLLQVLMHCTPNSTTSVHLSLLLSVCRGIYSSYSSSNTPKLPAVSGDFCPLPSCEPSLVSHAILTHTFTKWWPLMNISPHRLTHRWNMGFVSSS